MVQKKKCASSFQRESVPFRAIPSKNADVKTLSPRVMKKDTKLSSKRFCLLNPFANTSATSKIAPSLCLPVQTPTRVSVGPKQVEIPKLPKFSLTNNSPNNQATFDFKPPVTKTDCESDKGDKSASGSFDFHITSPSEGFSFKMRPMFTDELINSFPPSKVKTDFLNETDTFQPINLFDDIPTNGFDFSINCKPGLFF